MNTKDIKRMLSNGNGHSFSKSMSRAMGRSRGRSLSRSLQSFSKQHTRHNSTGVALPLLIGIGAVALIGAGADFLMRRSSGEGIMSRIMGEGGLNYSAVHGTAGAEMPNV